MTHKPEWVGTCVHLLARDLETFDDSSREITYRTFLRHVGTGIVRELNEQFGFCPTVKNDYHVQFFKGKWRGQPAVCMMHSAIHHIWKI